MLIMASCFVAPASGSKKGRPPALVGETRVVMRSVDPNIGTPTGQGPQRVLKETPDQNRKFREKLDSTVSLSASTPDKILTKYFGENGAKVVKRLQIVNAPGVNHGISGIIEIETGGMFPHRLFVIERTGEAQRDQLIWGNGNLFDAGHKLETLTDRLHAAYIQLDKGVVALVDRIRITLNDAEPSYLELYLAVEGDNCHQLLKDGIGNPAKTDELIVLCEQIGKQVYKMEEAGSPHEDCHPGNFLSPAFAIDFRRIAEVQSDPFSNFSEKLLAVFVSKLKTIKGISLTEIYLEQFVACLKAFIGQATKDSNVVARVFTGLKMTCENRGEYSETGYFYTAVLNKLKAIDGEQDK